MIKYDLTNINKWYNGSRNIVKCYHGTTNAFDLTGGGAPTPPPTPTGQTPCYAVTNDISQYQATDFVDVYDTTADKWYKLNNLNEYGEYGIYGSGRTNTTYYEGKLTIDGDYEYIYSGNSWVNLGEVSGVTTQTVWYDPPSSGSNNANFNIGHYWGENYKMIYTMYLQGSYSGDKGSFWQDNQKSPLEFHFYANGYYFDLHNPTSTSSPSVNTTDNDYRILKQSVFKNYESGQVMNVTLTYGSVKVELEESGTVIESTGSTRTGYSWYNGLYEPSIMLNNTAQTCHVSRIQVYNASDVLVNDLKFVKNNGVTGSQEISMVDTVLNVVYNNTNGNTPCYHVVEDGGSTVYPEYYDEIAEPPMSLTFATMADALAYQCPYVGLRATIAGDNYIFNSNYEWEEVTSRLPVGYTEVEYIQNTGTSYLNIAFVPNQDTRVVCEMQMVTSSNYPRLWGAGAWNSATGLLIDYDPNQFQVSWLGKTSWTNYSSISTSSYAYQKREYDLNKNSIYIDGTLVGSNTYTTRTASDNLGVFTHIGSGRPSSSGYWGQEHFKGKMFSFKVYDNGTLVRDLIPCKRDADNEVGAYDIVNDVFYTVPTGYTTDKLIAGNPV